MKLLSQWKAILWAFELEGKMRPACVVASVSHLVLADSSGVGWPVCKMPPGL